MNKKMVAMVVATIGLTLVGIAAWWRARGEESVPDSASAQGESGESLSPLPGESPTPPAAAPANAPRLPAALVLVEIQGAVAAPGVYSFPGDGRVFDALQKAGGALNGAEIRDINIAARLVDGSVLSIPYQQPSGTASLPTASDLNPPAYTRSGWTGMVEATATPVGGVAPASPSAKININTASQAELETLPGVGEKTAEKIMRHRESQPFTQVDDLGYVQGIGEKRLETLRPHVTVE
ncbi:MAG: ComEA family DNA-binding protein [Candidatus Hydrogenedentes bacterium]|nr:ComEA family DNA-binding protein [Candidatus Hydrogenedentota bacterium]